MKRYLKAQMAPGADQGQQGNMQQQMPTVQPKGHGKVMLYIGLLVVIIVAAVGVYFLYFQKGGVQGPSGPGSTTVSKKNLTLASQFPNQGSKSNYTTFTAIIDTAFNNTATLAVNYTGQAKITTYYGGKPSVNGSLIASAVNKYYKNVSAISISATSSSRAVTDSFYLNSTGPFYACSSFSTQSSNSMNFTCYGTRSIALPFDFASFTFGILSLYTQPNITVTMVGQRSFNGQTCTLLSGAGTIPSSLNKNYTRNVTFTTCISNTYSIPFNITEVQTLPNVLILNLSYSALTITPNVLKGITKLPGPVKSFS